MVSAPLVTIVTPTHCRPEMFAECAAAVLSQTFTNWVWYVVFNCSCWPRRYAPADCWSDPRIVTIWFPVTEGERKDRHVPACIVNWLYPKVTTPYIYFLADDDLIDPDGLGEMVREIQDLPRNEHLHGAVYGRCEVVDQQADGSYAHACWCYEDGDVGLGTGIDPNCRLDGGQVLHTKALWDRATLCEQCDGKGYTSTFLSSAKPLTDEWQTVSERYTQDPCLACNSTGKSWQLTDSKDDAATNDGTLLARMAEFARFHYVPTKIVTHRRHAGATHHKPNANP